MLENAMIPEAGGAEQEAVVRWQALREAMSNLWSLWVCLLVEGTFCGLKGQTKRKATISEGSPQNNKDRPIWEGSRGDELQMSTLINQGTHILSRCPSQDVFFFACPGDKQHLLSLGAPQVLSVYLVTSDQSCLGALARVFNPGS